MEEIEVPTEHLHEQMQHEAEHAHERWITRVALSSALIAVFAAITALLAGHHANEAMIEQIQASNQWAYYQAKGIKANVLQSKMELLASQGKENSHEDKERVERYEREQEKIKEVATEKEHHAETHLNRHMIFARGVTLFQVAIAIAAISAVLRRRQFWYVGLAFGAAGSVFLIQGLFTH